MYRKDVLERIDYMFRKGDLKPNFAKLAREMGCDYRTVKKAYESAQDPDSPPDPPPGRGNSSAHSSGSSPLRS